MLVISPDKSLPLIVWPSLLTLAWEKRFRLSYPSNLPPSASRPCNPLMDSCEVESRTCPPQTSVGPSPQNPLILVEAPNTSTFCAPMSTCLPNRTYLRCRKNGMSLMPKRADCILLHESSLWNAAFDALDESRRPSSKRK